MSQIAKIKEFGTSMGIPCVIVQSMRSEEECYKLGYRYEWGINKYSFTRDRESIKEALGIDDKQYDYWLKQYPENNS